RQILLERATDGEWRNRLSDVARWSAKRRQLSWRGTEAPRAQWMEGEYDPRLRPWYLGATTLVREADVYWSDPYVFFTSREPGITAAVKGRGRGEEAVIVAADVKLVNLSRFIADLKVGRRGRTAVLTHDGRIVAIAPDAAGGDADPGRLVLKSPAEAGAQTLALAQGLWEAAGRPYGAVSRVDAEGEAWLARFQSVPVGNGHF